MNKGFTLVELIAVITILALLVIITTPAYDSISTNIKTRNYQSKKNTIEAETLSYIEKYLKDEIYSGIDSKDTDTKGKCKCFTVNYLIRSGIISSDSDTEEYIYNELDNKKFAGNDVYLKVWYDTKNLKLKAQAADSSSFGEPDCKNNLTNPNDPLDNTY